MSEGTQLTPIASSLAIPNIVCWVASTLTDDFDSENWQSTKLLIVREFSWLKVMAKLASLTLKHAHRGLGFDVVSYIPAL